MCVKTKINTPLHVCSTEQRCDKTRELTPFVRGKRRLCIKKVPRLKLFNPFSISRKLPANGCYFCVSTILSPWVVGCMPCNRSRRWR